MMSIITLDEFPEFVEAYPEMEPFYDLYDEFAHQTTEDIVYGDTCAD